MEQSSKQCPYCGEEILSVAKKCKYCGEWLNSSSLQNNFSEMLVVKKIADLQRISNIIWLIVAIIQICSIIGIIAGIWNLIATFSYWDLPKKILKQDRDIPSFYKGIVGLIVLAVANFLLGGLIGVFIVGFDFYIRGLVLDNKHLFINKEVL